MGDQDLIDRYIDCDQYGRVDARLRDSSIHVWAIIGQLRTENGSVDSVARAYDIPTSAVESARAYYQKNKKYIDARLLLNSA
jgi:uncharacterized protein (DUF433 family)